jgi:hypothetical protein
MAIEVQSRKKRKCSCPNKELVLAFYLAPMTSYLGLVCETCQAWHYPVTRIRHP